MRAPDGHYFDPLAHFTAHRANLPHRDQTGTLTFVTFRLGDALPAEFWADWQERLRQWRLDHPEPHDRVTRVEYHDRFVRPLTHRLDAGTGSCVLADPAVQAAVAATLHARAAIDYRLDAYAIAPNHVHALFTPALGVSLTRILQAWKSVTAHHLLKNDRAYAALAAHEPGRARPLVWQKESYDHLVRSPAAHAAIRAYILAHRGMVFAA